MLIKDVTQLLMEKLKFLRWGKIEIIVRDAKITQINTIEEERL